MIFVGIDDTDILGARGTNQLAREIVRRAADRWTCRWIARHQLLYDARIPYTSKNGSASIVFDPQNGASLQDLATLCRDTMRDWFIAGSDPGLCVTDVVPAAITEFSRRCQREIVTQDLARELAGRCAIHLEGLGGTEGGVIGALAAVGLAVTGDDGRIIQWQTWPDDLSGCQSIADLNARRIAVRDERQAFDLREGIIDVGKHLRPNLRAGRAVLFVKPDPAVPDSYVALKLV